MSKEKTTKNIPEVIHLLPIKPKLAKIKIRGLTSLLVHYFHPEKQKAILDKQQKKATERKPKDIQHEFEMSLYPKQNGKHVYPSGNIKAACVDAAHTFVPTITKKQARGMFFIPVDWLVIEGPDPVTHKANVKLDGMGGVTDIRIRPEFKEWQMTIPIEYDENGPLSIEQIVNLIQKAGFYVGTGEWRPLPKKGKPGIHGRFEIVKSKK